MAAIFRTVYRTPNRAVTFCVKLRVKYPSLAQMVGVKVEVKGQIRANHLKMRQIIFPMEAIK